jgi:hypothetical protein
MEPARHPGRWLPGGEFRQSGRSPHEGRENWIGSDARRRSNGNVGSRNTESAGETHPMNNPPHGLRDLVRRLIAFETARAGTSNADAPAAVRVLDKLKLPLSKLAGPAGFHSLLSRALALAKVEDASLSPVRVGASGALEGFAGDGRGPDAGTAGEDGGAVVVAHLLALLVTLIGEPLAMRLVRDAWPDTRADETNGSVEGEP